MNEWVVKRSDGAFYMAEATAVWWTANRREAAVFPEDRARALARDLNQRLTPEELKGRTIAAEPLEPKRAERPVATMRQHELTSEAARLGIKNTDGYLADELRRVVAARLADEARR